MIIGHWLARALTVGPTTDGRLIGTRLATRVAALLPGVLVGFTADGLGLVHPEREGIQVARVGRVLRAWLSRGGDVLATLAIEVERVHRGLERLAHAGHLRHVGISLIFDEPIYAPNGSPAALVDVAGIASLDFVTRPACRGACVLRRITISPKEVATT